jgi:response regulator RpfG family c-di-GMP phosphodiesterase
MNPPEKHCLLVVDDEPDVCDSVYDLLRREFRVLRATSAQEGYRLMQEEEVHIIMTDQRMPQVTGVELLAKAKARSPQAVRMLFTGYADLESIIAAINQGHVYQFLKKPWQPEELQAAVRQAAAPE